MTTTTTTTPAPGQVPQRVVAFRQRVERIRAHLVEGGTRLDQLLTELLVLGRPCGEALPVDQNPGLLLRAARSVLSEMEEIAQEDGGSRSLEWGRKFAGAATGYLQAWCFRKLDALTDRVGEFALRFDNEFWDTPPGDQMQAWAQEAEELLQELNDLEGAFDDRPSINEHWQATMMKVGSRLAMARPEEPTS